MNQDMAWMMLRYTLLAAGGMAVAKGWVSDEQVVSLVGAAGVVFTILWGTYIKWNTKTVSQKVIDNAKADPTVPTIPTLSPSTGNVS